MKSLEIVLRTCDHTNVHNDWRVRYFGGTKKELIYGCVNSLIKSCQNVRDLKLTVLDDHSSDETVNWLKSTLENSNLEYEFNSLHETGYNHSAFKQWERCRDSEYDLVYSVEDDYLHYPSAIQEMIDSYEIFCDRLKRNSIVLYPFDEPSEYNPPQRKDFIVHGSNRHWRTGIFTTNVLFCQPKIFKDYWHLFEILALKYNGDYLNPRVEHYEESNTIWSLWNDDPYIRFNPIPSLALHMQFEPQKDPFIDWKKWWSDYGCDLDKIN
jgi:glycosyltransferase involved in cell wall biosynthesis